MQSLINTVRDFFTGLYERLAGIFTSLMDFFTELPVLIFEKAMSLVTWFFNWASETCSVCIGGVTTSGSLAFSMQSGFNGLPPSVIWFYNQSGLHEGFQILTCAIAVWGTLKVVKFAMAVL